MKRINGLTDKQTQEIESFVDHMKSKSIWNMKVKHVWVFAAAHTVTDECILVPGEGYEYCWTCKVEARRVEVGQ